MAEGFALREELNGLGGRVSDLKNEVGKHEERIDRTRDDIKESWSKIDKLREDLKDTDSKIQGVELNLSTQVAAMEATVQREVGTLRVDFEKTASKLSVRIATIAGTITAAGAALVIAVQYLLR